MKNRTHINILLSTLTLFVMATTVAQNASADVYRVTAVQKSNNQILSISNEAAIIPAAVLYIPNAFTPNGDGLNDSFGCIGEGITEYTLQIFDRWGSLIFESSDMKVQWDGNYKNELAPTGVYVYKVRAVGPGMNGSIKKQINKAGSVTLVI